MERINREHLQRHTNTDIIYRKEKQMENKHLITQIQKVNKVFFFNHEFWSIWLATGMSDFNRLVDCLESVASFIC